MESVHLGSGVVPRRSSDGCCIGAVADATHADRAACLEGDGCRHPPKGDPLWWGCVPKPHIMFTILVADKPEWQPTSPGMGQIGFTVTIMVKHKRG